MAKWHSPNADIKVTMSDTKPIINRLATLPDKLQKKGANTAARKGMNIVKRAAVKNAKALDDPETKNKVLWRNVTVQRAPKLGKANGGVAFRVGLLGGARAYSNIRHNRRKNRVGKLYKTNGDSGNPGGDTWYWRFLEFGTSGMRARPFLRRALEDNIQQVTNVTTYQLSVEIDKLVPNK